MIWSFQYLSYYYNLFSSQSTSFRYQESDAIWMKENLYPARFAINVRKCNEKCILVLPIGNMKCHRFFASCMKKNFHWLNNFNGDLVRCILFAFNISNVKEQHWMRFGQFPLNYFIYWEKWKERNILFISATLFFLL